MNQFFNDILKSRGKYSRKSIIIAITFLFILFAGGFIIASEKCNEQSVGIFNSLLWFEATLLGISIVDKKIANKDKTEE